MSILDKILRTPNGQYLRVNGYTSYIDILKGTKIHTYILADTKNQSIEEVSCQDQITKTLSLPVPSLENGETYTRTGSRIFRPKSLVRRHSEQFAQGYLYVVRIYVSGLTLGCDVDSAYAALTSFSASFM